MGECLVRQLLARSRLLTAVSYTLKQLFVAQGHKQPFELRDSSCLDKYDTRVGKRGK